MVEHHTFDASKLTVENSNIRVQYTHTANMTANISYPFYEILSPMHTRRIYHPIQAERSRLSHLWMEIVRATRDLTKQNKKKMEKKRHQNFRHVPCANVTTKAGFCCARKIGHGHHLILLFFFIRFVRSLSLLACLIPGVHFKLNSKCVFSCIADETRGQRP